MLRLLYQAPLACLLISLFTLPPDAKKYPQVSVFKCFWTMLAVLERRLSLVWGWSLSGFRVVLQSSLLDGVAFDPFSFQEDGPVSAEVDVGGRQVL